jgi:4-hydroxy-tetrahydrodipicolinate synthase
LTLGGILPVIQTPFRDDGAIDHTSLATLVRFAARSGASGVVYPANASEFYTLGRDERERAVATVFSAADSLAVVACVSDPDPSCTAAYARQARRLGATAIMVLPTYRREVDAATLIEYFEHGLRAAELPIILQNVGPPVGVAIDQSVLEAILEVVPEIEYIKEERVPTTHRISQIVDAFDGRLRGVIGGANGQWLVQESRRGACGCMPAGALVDLQAEVFAATEQGHWEQARQLQARLQPLLSYTSIYGVSMVKETLRMRGLMPNAHTRDPAAVRLDEDDRAELRLQLAQLSLLGEDRGA